MQFSQTLGKQTNEKLNRLSDMIQLLVAKIKEVQPKQCASETLCKGTKVVIERNALQEFLG